MASRLRTRKGNHEGPALRSDGKQCARRGCVQISLRKIRGYRLIPAILAITWLPYISTRCVENPATHAGCHMFPGAVHAAQEHGEHHRHAPVHTCCDLTGKCNVRVVPEVPQLDAPALVATLPLAVAVVVPVLSSPTFCDISLVAHSPPTYLCNATLLL
jgi:hypothetical protein